MRLMVSGSRHCRDRATIRAALRTMEPDALIHGDQRGADRIADDEAMSLGWAVQAYPADWETYGAAAGPLRNGAMARSRPTMIVAFPHHDSKGTWDAVRAALREGVKVGWIVRCECADPV